MAHRIGELVPLQDGGVMKKILPLFKWKRKQGMATFLRDLLDLRKTISLCKSCERKMPRHWGSRYNYSFVRGFYAEHAACDWCRLQDSTNMYMPVDGKYHQEMMHMKRHVDATRERERTQFLKDSRHFIGV